MFGHSIVVVPDPAFDPLVKPAFEDLDLRIGGIGPFLTRIGVDAST